MEFGGQVERVEQVRALVDRKRRLNDVVEHELDVLGDLSGVDVGRDDRRSARGERARDVGPAADPDLDDVLAGQTVYDRLVLSA